MSLDPKSAEILHLLPVSDLISFNHFFIKIISLPGSSCFPRCTHLGLEHFFYFKDEFGLMLLFISLPTSSVGAAASLSFFVKTAEQGHTSFKCINNLDVLILLMY